MKKILAFIMLCACVMTTQAKSDLQLKKGSIVELKGSNASLSIVWDYINSTIEKKAIKDFLREKGADWEADYDNEIKKAEANFISRLNDKSKDVRAITEGNGDYKIVVKVSEFHYGSAAASVLVGFGAGDARLYGLIEIYKKGSTEPIAVLDMDGVSGSGYGNEVRRVEAYRELAELLSKLIKKAK